MPKLTVETATTRFSQPGKRLVHAGTCLWPAALMVWGPGQAAGRHAHYCGQLCIALEGTLGVRVGADARWRRSTAVVVGRDIVHEIDARGAFVVMAFVGAEIPLGTTGPRSIGRP